DVDSVCDARDALRLTLGRHWREPLERLYEANAPVGPFDPAAPAMARRSLKHAALALLGPVLDGAAAEALLTEHYRLADNLTDRQAALGQICRHPALDPAVRDGLLADFYGCWQHEALVVNVWFSLQAASPLYDAAAMRALAEHPAFDALNPNKLRALYGTFSRQNHRRFHEIGRAACMKEEASTATVVK